MSPVQTIFCNVVNNMVIHQDLENSYFLMINGVPVKKQKPYNALSIRTPCPPPKKRNRALYSFMEIDRLEVIIKQCINSYIYESTREDLQYANMEHHHFLLIKKQSYLKQP